MLNISCKAQTKKIFIDQVYKLDGSNFQINVLLKDKYDYTIYDEIIARSEASKIDENCTDCLVQTIDYIIPMYLVNKYFDISYMKDLTVFNENGEIFGKYKLKHIIRNVNEYENFTYGVLERIDRFNTSIQNEGSYYYCVSSFADRIIKKDILISNTKEFNVNQTLDYNLIGKNHKILFKKLLKYNDVKFIVVSTEKNVNETYTNDSMIIKEDRGNRTLIKSMYNSRYLIFGISIIPIMINNNPILAVNYGMPYTDTWDRSLLIFKDGEYIDIPANTIEANLIQNEGN